MMPVSRTTSYLALLLVAAVVILQFVAVQHSIEHGSALPDNGCEFCVSGTATASLSSHLPDSTPALSFADAPRHEPLAAPSASRRARPPARGPPRLV